MVRPLRLVIGVAVACALAPISLPAPLAGQTPPGPSETQLLERAAAEAEKAGPQIALARFYYEARRLADAERAAATALDLVKANRVKQAAGLAAATPRALPWVGIDVPEPGKTRDEAPRYPEAALRARALGIVIIDAVIDKEGRIRNAKAIRSVPQLDKAALDAVRQWRFVPTVRDGQVIDVAVMLTVNFTFRVDPQVPDDLDVADFYHAHDQFELAERVLGRALTLVRRESVCFGPGRRGAGIGPGDGTGGGRRSAEFTEATKIKDLTPQYPKAAMQARLSGTVFIQAAIDREGHVTCTRVVSRSSVFDQEALNAVRQWRFTPALLNGVPVPTFLATSVNFSFR